jgi:hypothetical protein
MAMIVLPELEWGTLNLLIPVSVALVLYSAFSRRGAENRPWRFAVASLVLFVVTAHLFFSLASLGNVFYRYADLVFAPGNIVLVTITSAVVAGILYWLAHFISPATEKSLFASTLLIAGFFVASFSTYLKISYGGWGIIGPVGTGIVYVLAVFHCTQRTVICLRPQRVGSALPWIADSMFLFAGLLRLDMDDGSSWVTIDVLNLQWVGLPVESIGELLGESGLQWFNFLVHAPLLITWFMIEVVMYRRPMPKASPFVVGTAP